MSHPLRRLAGQISADNSPREVAFSEITLGRLLLAAEFQILVVSTMVFAFHSMKTAEGSTRPSYGKRASSFRGLQLSIYDSGPGLYNPNRTSRLQSRPSSGQNISTWLDKNAQSRPPSRFERMLADGPNAYPSEKEILAFAGDMVPDSAQSSSRWDGPVYPSSIVNSFVGIPFPPAISSPSSAPAGQFSARSTSTYDAKKASWPSVPGGTMVATGPGTPVLGSDGMSSARKSTRFSPPLQPLSNASFASSGASDYENLFRKQIELEKSIAALRASTPLGKQGDGQVDRDTTFDLPERGTARESSTTGNGHTSTSGKSEFSLSIFPEPPKVRRFDEDYRQSSSSSILLPPRLSVFTAGFPTSSIGSEDGTTLGLRLRTSSIGTRYDVTSFIGGGPPSFHELIPSQLVSIDLSSPDDSLTHSPAPRWISDTDSEAGSVVQATIETVERNTSIISRPRLVRNSSLAINTSTSAISRSRGLDSPSVRDVNTPTLKQIPPISAVMVSPPPAIYTPGDTTPPRTPSTKRVVGPSRLADPRNWDVLGKPVPL